MSDVKNLRFGVCNVCLKPICQCPKPKAPHALTREQCSLCTANRPRLCDQHYKQGADELLKRVTDAIQDQQTPGGVKATYEQLLELCNQQRQALAQQAQEIERLQQEVYNRNQRALDGDKAVAVRESILDTIDRLTQQLATMTAERDAAEQQVAQLDHKNCDLMRRNRILRTRPDLPMTHEEKARYKQLENQVARLREMAEHAVNEEPEMPGEMPLALYEQIKQLDRAGMAEWARIIAWQTKAGVLGRLHALLETEGE